MLECAAPMTPRRLCVYADLDSQIYGSLGPARTFRNRGWQVAFNIPNEKKIPSTLLRDVRKDYPVMSLGAESFALHPLVFETDALLVLAVGSTIAQIRRDIQLVYAIRERRPLLVTGFNGIVFEKFEEGLSWRLGYDLVYLNSPADLAKATRFLDGTQYASQPFVIAGLNRGSPSTQRADQSHPRRRALFAEQVNVPDRHAERRWLFERLVELAKANPDWDIVIKPRVRPGEATFFKPILSPEDALNANPHVLFDYRPLTQQLPGTDLLLTVSSTAAFDALTAGVQACYVADFGIRNAYGTHVFFGSGLEIFLGDSPSLDAYLERPINSTWYKEVGASCSMGALVEAVEEARTRTGPIFPSPYDRRMFPVPKAFGDEGDLQSPKKPNISPSTNFDSHMSKGKDLMAREEYAAAATEYSRAARTNPHSTNALRALADAQAAAGDKRSAAMTLQRVTTLRPENKNVRRRLWQLLGLRLMFTQWLRQR